MRRVRAWTSTLLLACLATAAACGGDETRRPPSATATPSPQSTPTRTLPPSPSASPVSTSSATAAATTTPTGVATLTPTPTTAAPTATPTGETATFYRAPALTEPAGPRADGVSGVLPNGRVVEPVGRQVPVDTFPLSVRVGATGHVFVTNDGNGNPESERFLQVIDPQTLEVRRTPSTHFFGLAISPDGRRVYTANGPAHRIEVFDFDGTALTRVEALTVVLPDGSFPMGIDLSPDGRTLYAVGFLTNTFFRINLESGAVQEADQRIGNFPYAVVASKDGRTAYVSSWGLNNGNPGNISPRPLPPTDPNATVRSSVAVIDVGAAGAPVLQRYVPIGRTQRIDNTRVFGGSHPSGMSLSADGALLYVTASNVDVLSVIDTATDQLVAEIDLNVFADGLQGLYPNAVAVSADGRRVYVADAGINAVQVIDVDPVARRFTPQGFIPTGWYPTGVALSQDGATLYVSNGKGLGIGPNGAELIDINTITMSGTPYYIGRLVKGSVSVVDLPNVDLDAGSARVRANNGFNPFDAAAQRGALRDGPVPRDFGAGPSQQIKYVVYILKENRTYDQVFGEFERGNGDPRLTLFGEDVTPNHYALARQFAMGDNFFNDAEVSYPGHEWITQGNNNDFVEKIWPIEYNGSLNAPYNIETGMEGFCKNGYIFEALSRQQVPFRVYGEPLAFNSGFAAGINGRGVPSTIGRLITAFGSIDALVNGIDELLAGDLDALRAQGVDTDILTDEIWPNLLLSFPSNILADKTDVFRAELFRGELQRFATSNDMPRFIFLWLPNDHTFGAAPSMPSPRTAVADNDRGLGMVVDALTKSPFWPQMAIFVSEDDAQDGQDHVSAHRTISLVISPYVKHAYTSPVHHSNVSMLKTMELLLGVAPMSQYDRYATDMRDYFTTTPDLTPYTALAARVQPTTNPSPDDAPNDYLREAAVVSERLDFNGYDEAGPELSRVLWLVHFGERLQARRRWGGIGAAVLASALAVGRGMRHRRRRGAVRG